MSLLPELPVNDVLAELRQALTESSQVVLQAPPGAGKTTLVPLALIEEAWLGHRKILMLEPRRLATRGAAYRMADLLGEQVGQTVGYRMRLESRVSDYSKIEVITEGILTRMLQEDPSLESVGLVIFDEFHERSLDADLALALTLKGREVFREDESLRVLVMSATLDGETLASMLDAPLITSHGRQYPVEVHYGKALQPRQRVEERIVPVVREALKNHPQSSHLVFLPGEAEIRRTESALQELPGQLLAGVDICPLFGNLSMEAQQAAITPAPNGRRKIVLATNIAETSLTIDGVDVVIDAGLARAPSFDPNTAMTRLETRRISQASSEQRSGRAGRLAPGHSYRLWSKDQQQQMAMHDAPEIMNADLAPLALQLINWGINHPSELRWLNEPPGGAWEQAVTLLKSLGIVNEGASHLVLSEHGELVSQLAVHPRLGHMLILGAEAGYVDEACLLAAVLSDRDPLTRDSADMLERLDILQGKTVCPGRHRGWQRRTEQLASQFKSSIPRVVVQQMILPTDQVLGYLLASAYPDRIARRRHSGGYQLANGRGAEVANRSGLAKATWLAVAEIGGRSGKRSDQIRSAAILDERLFEGALSELVLTIEAVEWDKKSGRLVAERRTCIGALVLDRERLSEVPEALRLARLIGHVRETEMKVLPWNSELQQWCARVDLLRNARGSEWPDTSQAALLASLEDWLGPFLVTVNRQSEFNKLDLSAALHAMLTWDQQQELERLAPARITAPSGNNHKIDYSQSPPVLAVKLQEMFGCEALSAIADGAVPVMIHLLSPAGRPLQVTQDLASFWRNGYDDVRKEMKGRYPKHPWPEDPLKALPTARTKRKAE